MSKNFVIVDREEFINARYKRFMKKKHEVRKLPEDVQSKIIYTDLDKDYPDTGPLKHVVICDMCNENIEEAAFLMVHESRVYHWKCGHDTIPKGIKTGLETIYKSKCKND